MSLKECILGKEEFDSDVVSCAVTAAKGNKIAGYVEYKSGIRVSFNINFVSENAHKTIVSIDNEQGHEKDDFITIYVGVGTNFVTMRHDDYIQFMHKVEDLVESGDNMNHLIRMDTDESGFSKMVDVVPASKAHSGIELTGDDNVQN